MARARTLKPGFFTNETLAECDPLARILFQGLWCHADREGRLECRPKRLKAEILPYDKADVRRLLGQLADRGFIVIYQASGAEYIQVSAFAKHQNPHVREVPSTIPAPGQHDAGMGGKAKHDLGSAENGASTMLNPGKPAPAGPITLSPFPSPLTPYPRSAGALTNGAIEKFEAWYAAYPRHVARGAAEKAFTKAILLAPLADLIAGAQRYARSVAGKEPQYVAHPATWLNQRRWSDEPPGTDLISEQTRPVAPPRPETFGDA